MNRVVVLVALLALGGCSEHTVEATTVPGVSPIAIQSTRFHVRWDVAIGSRVEGRAVVQNHSYIAAGQSASVRCEGRPKGRELLVWSDESLTSQLGPTGTEELWFYGTPTRDGILDITCTVVP